MNIQSLRQKVRSLASYKVLDAEAVRKFGEILETADDWELYRINPLDFAKRQGMDAAMTLEIFVHAAKIGLFDFEWNLLCPLCGGVIYSQGSIGNINREKYHCATCDTDTATDLDDYVEVAFSIDPAIKKLRLAPFSSMQNYQRYFYSSHHHMPREFEDYRQKKGFIGFITIESGEAGTLCTKTVTDGLYRVVNADNNGLLKIKTTAKKADTPLIVDVDVTPAGFTPDTIEVDSGETTVKIHNHLNRTIGVMMNFIDYQGIMGIIEKTPPWDDPFLTGKALLNNQSFRDLFRIQTLPNDLKLKVSHVTILFTDLKGSTELYDRTGDMTAYNLVQEHFEILKEKTRKHSGAIVKTIGDAIMAAFSSPTDAILASIDMLDGIKALNERSVERPIAIKVGFHTGTALAVTANETIDYFGQTVNIAARVQGLADGGEIWITGPAFKTRSFRKIIGDIGFSFEKQSAILKGVRKPITVYKCHGC